MQGFLIAVFAVLAMLMSVSFAEETPKFNFKDYINGEFNCNVYTGKVDSSYADVEPEYIVSLNLSPLNGTESLAGLSFHNHTSTGEITNLQSLRLDFISAAAGTYQVGESDTDLAPQFSFDFQDLGNGVHMSQGKFGADATFQWIVTGKDSFLLVVNRAGEITTFVGSRIVKQLNQTFFEKYRTWIMIGGMMIFNTYMQSKAANAQGQVADSAVAAVAADAGKKDN